MMFSTVCITPTNNCQFSSSHQLKSSYWECWASTAGLSILPVRNMPLLRAARKHLASKLLSFRVQLQPAPLINPTMQLVTVAVAPDRAEIACRRYATDASAAKAIGSLTLSKTEMTTRRWSQSPQTPKQQQPRYLQLPVLRRSQHLLCFAPTTPLNSSQSICTYYKPCLVHSLLCQHAHAQFGFMQLQPVSIQQG